MIEDFYLDVVNSLDGFPEDDTHSYLYIQGSYYDKKVSAHTTFTGTYELLSSSIIGAMENEEMAIVTCDAVIEYMTTNDNEITKTFLNEITKLQSRRQGTTPKVRKRRSPDGEPKQSVS